MLPDTPDFRFLLRSLQVVKGQGQIVLGAVIAALTTGGKPAELFLNYEEKPNGRLGALVKKIREAFEREGHPNTENLVYLFLANFSLHRDRHECPISLFNDLIGSFHEVDVSHYFLTPFAAGLEPPAEFFGFRFGRVADLSLEFRSRKANSNYYALHGHHFGSSHGIESPVFRRRLPDLLGLLHRRAHANDAAPRGTLDHEVLLRYYEELSKVLFEKMWDDLEGKQLLSSALDAGLIDTEKWRAIPGSQGVTIYLNQYKERWDGYTCPLGNMVSANVIAGDSPFLKRAKDLEERYGSSQLPIIRQFCHFGVQGHRKLLDADVSGGFLQFMIALELLLGEKGNTTKAISNRAAVLISPASSESFVKTRSRIETIYNARSRYVHDGIHPTAEIAEETKGIFVKLLSRILLHPFAGDDHELAHKEWKKNVDFVASGYDANRIPSEELRALLGIEFESESFS